MKEPNFLYWLGKDSVYRVLFHFDNESNEIYCSQWLFNEEDEKFLLDVSPGMQVKRFFG